jgi:hypothetical protein
MKLNQLIAIVTGEKTSTQKKITELYKRVQHGDLFSGISRTYIPKDDEGERLPSENKKVQVTAEEVLESARNILRPFWDLLLTQDDCNCSAKADITIDNNVLVSEVPVTFLLFFEKQLVDLRTLVEKIPTLDPAEEWRKPAGDIYNVTGPIETLKTKKVPKNHVKAEATKEHPAQVEVYHEDVIIGTWKTFKYSGALAPADKAKMLERIDILIKATKVAREEANNEEVTNMQDKMKKVFDYILSPS